MTLREVVQQVLKHRQDLYEGNGKPGITTRLELIERDNANQRLDIEDLCKGQDKMATEIQGMKIQWAKLTAYVSAATVVAVVAGHLIDHFWGK